MSIRDSYDAAAEGYAEHLFRELDGKPLDRHLLNRFAEEVQDGPALDLGCGPGHITRYLHARGVQAIGIDLSAGMVETARRRNPGLDFRIADMRSLPFTDGNVAGIIAFYSIVHFPLDELGAVFSEIRRALRDDGVALIAFHVGDGVVHVEELFGSAVSLDFHFHQPEAVAASMVRAGLHVTESVLREPYAGAEHPSRRCYLFARAAEPRDD